MKADGLKRFFENVKRKENVIIPILCHFIILNCSCTIIIQTKEYLTSTNKLQIN